jgi:hypothetical protein
LAGSTTWFELLSNCGTIAGANYGYSFAHDHNGMRRSLSALAMTETELNVIAALAIMGLSRIPKNG